MDNKVITQTKKWIEQIVIGLNFCPFANAPFRQNTIRYQVSAAHTEAELLQDILQELNLLIQNPTIETTLLIHPTVLTDFMVYNDFLFVVDQIIEQAELEGIIQVASFHPAYRFDDTESTDRENYTNRSPYPMLHFLREASVEKATTTFPNVEEIPNKNIETLQQLSDTDFQKKFGILKI